MTIDPGILLQGVIAAVLIGVGKTIYSTAITLAETRTDLKSHKDEDKTFHSDVKEEFRDIRGRLP